MLHRLASRYGEIRNARTGREAWYRIELEGCPGIGLPSDGGESINLLRLPLLFESASSRDTALDRLDRAGLGGTGMYPAPLHRLAGLNEYFPATETHPNAESVAGRILTLPLHDRVKRTDVARIGEIVRSVCETGRD